MTRILFCFLSILQIVNERRPIQIGKQCFMFSVVADVTG